MAYQLKYDVFKITQWKDGCVYRTQKVTSVWITAGTKTEAEKQAIAREHGGDMLVNTTESRIA